MPLQPIWILFLLLPFKYPYNLIISCSFLNIILFSFSNQLALLKLACSHLLLFYSGIMGAILFCPLLRLLNSFLEFFFCVSYEVMIRSCAFPEASGYCSSAYFLQLKKQLSCLPQQTVFSVGQPTQSDPLELGFVHRWGMPIARTAILCVLVR